MPRLVLLYTGAGGMPAQDVAAIRAMPGVRVDKVLDFKDAGMMYMEGSASIKSAVNRMVNWVASEEQLYDVPETRVDRLSAVGASRK